MTNATDSKRALPGSLNGNRRIDQWLGLPEPGRVRVSVGKVEIGQGITTALLQIAADEFDVDPGRVTMPRPSTAASPDEGVTSGSRSIEESGEALRAVCAEARDILVQEAAKRLGVSVERLTVDDGTIRVRDSGQSITYWDLPAAELFAREASGDVKPKTPAEYRVIGSSTARLDVPGKISGGAFIHDMDLPGMLYGRVIRPPSYRATLVTLDEAGLRALPGIVAVVRDGHFVGIAGEREEAVVKAWKAADKYCTWSERPDLPDCDNLAVALKRLASRFEVVNEKSDPPAKATAAQRLCATYTKPFIAHATIGPSCGVAHYVDGHMHVWTHSQGIFLNRLDLTKALRLPAERITVTHMDGAGCYGHNGADDAALDAALIARAVPGKPVKVQWMREDEFGWEPFGPAMIVNLSGAVDAAGNIVDWDHEQWSNPHSMRAGRTPHCGLLASWYLAEPSEIPPALDMPHPAGGSDRNAIPTYAFPNQRIAKHLVTEMPVRVSALRTLGGFINVVASECFLDELAHAASADPVAFRLKHMKDPRARAVIEAAARHSGWNPADQGGNGAGRGIGYGRYKTVGAYCAVVAEIEVDRAIRVKRCVAAVDCGLVINPDGVINQIEGGIIQAISWTLKEQVRFDRTRILTRTWEDYPILTFSEIPAVEVHLIDRPEQPPKGTGEASSGPVGAAVANALFHALGIRVRDLPLSPERIVAAMGT
jgi:CO/xanthine dehydrogenase Mo-binding subunit